MSIFNKIIRFSSIYRFSSHLLFWLVVFIVPQWEAGTSFRNMLIENMFYVFFYMMASYFVAYFIIPMLLKGENYFLATVYFIVGAYIISAILRITVVYVLEPIVRNPPFDQEPILQILTDMHTLINVYFLQNFSLAWIFGFIKLMKDQYAIKQRTLLLEKEKTEAELNILKAQLNPHFLFNTLNNIYSLSLVNSPVTSKSIAGLSQILDHVLYRCNSTYVSISSEINLLINYIDLEKLRYSDRLVVNFHHNIEEESEIAPLILLSIVENAFKHGAGEDIGRPVIDIDLRLEGTKFYFKVTNTFIFREEIEQYDKIGLTNIRKQLEIIYPGNHELITSIKEGTFVTLLTITLDNQETTKAKSIDESKMSFSR
ncbi:sensor histidine kinase [Pedobacter insulae]|uniref:Histidine kinase n=1 Tax=Pedobacter insulae TaxID=414048 RepID=A0A1I2WT18_9SPHI|nr:sensor histidine kinase [Pedobacter insulae]SFH02741.1 Histidine kinase [Pedobacter insulae]